MLHTSPLAAAAGNETFEKEDEEEEHKEEEKRTCEMWQLKLSSGGGTYGIHFCVVFDDDWSFKPKNIVAVVVVVFLVVREKTTCSSYKKKVDSSKYSSSSVAPRERRPHRVGTFNQSSLLRCRFAPRSGSRALRSKTFQRRLSFSWKRHQSVL